MSAGTTVRRSRHSLSRNLTSRPQQTFQQGAGQQTYQQAQQGFNQQQASQQMDAVKKAGANAALDYVNVLKGLFTSPVETVSAFVAKANVIMIAILIGGQAIINMLTRLFDMLIANSKAKGYNRK